MRIAKHIKAVCKELESRNLDIVAAQFSGGNDEGGFDKVSAFKLKSEVPDIDTVSTWDVGTGLSQDALVEDPIDTYSNNEIDYSEMRDNLLKILDSYYGSFAGEYNTSGVILITQKKFAFRADETIQNYESRTDSYTLQELDELIPHS
tara:strand:- start:914 stop:1357 length:444 start_codon:yes stop_codon:yes gene_type:complete